MKPSHILVSLLFALFLPACLSTAQEPVDLETRNVDMGETQFIIVKMDRGELAISGTENGQIAVSGKAVYPEEVRIDIGSSDGQMMIVIQDLQGGISGNPLHVNLAIPTQKTVKVETDEASVLARGYSGGLEIASISGDVSVEDVTGNLTLRSNRGDVTVQDGTGNISVVGNYGILTVQDSVGDVGMSTIMGTIIFSGLIGEKNTVKLETDHGPVEVNLDSNSSLDLFVSSTSGDVACMIPDISSTPRSCEGQVGAGGGTLKIRTVSGAVMIRLIP